MTDTDRDDSLAARLGFGRGMKVWFRDLPADVRVELEGDASLDELAAPSQGIEGALIFVADRDAALREVRALYALLAPAGFIWVAAPDIDAVAAVAVECGLHAGERTTIAKRTAIRLDCGARRDD